MNEKLTRWRTKLSLHRFFLLITPYRPVLTASTIYFFDEWWCSSVKNNIHKSCYQNNCLFINGLEKKLSIFCLDRLCEKKILMPHSLLLNLHWWNLMLNLRCIEQKEYFCLQLLCHLNCILLGKCWVTHLQSKLLQLVFFHRLSLLINKQSCTLITNWGSDWLKNKSHQLEGDFMGVKGFHVHSPDPVSR